MGGMTHLVIQAQYCMYILADMADNAILQMNIVGVREAAGKSNNMERIGFERALNKILTSTITIKEVVTDGHLEIGTLMSKYILISVSRIVLVYYSKCCNLIGYSTRYLFLDR